jgi:hypothetical protein
MTAWFLLRRLGVLIGWSLGLGGVEAGLVNDPAGDASGHADAVSISGRYSGGNLYLTANFSDGSLNPTNLGFIFAFDVDQNPATGVQPPAAFPLGAESSVYFNSAASSNRASLSGPFQWADVTFGSNSLSLVIPLATPGFGETMGFGFIVGVPEGTNGFVAFDTVPDSAWGGPLSGLTSPVPELKIRREGTSNVVSWDARATDYVLQSAPMFSPTATWTDATNAVIITNGEALIRDSDPPPIRFYRMRL